MTYGYGKCVPKGHPSWSKSAKRADDRKVLPILYTRVTLKRPVDTRLQVSVLANLCHVGRRGYFGQCNPSHVSDKNALA